MKKTSITTSITEGQRKQFKRFVEDAADKALAEAGLDKDGIQRVIEKGDDLQATIVAKIKELSVTNKYADGEVSSNYGYLSGYKPLPIAEQVARLKELSPELKDATYDETLVESQLPQGAEGWFAIPKFAVVADTYNAAVQKVLDLLKQDRNGRFHNYCGGKLSEQYLRQSARSVRFWQQLAEQQQGHDILIVPAQFGLRHHGRSVRRTRAVFTADEFGLGAFANITMVLTHPDRLKNYNDLWIDCAGDEYAPGADGNFSSFPFLFFRFGDDGVGFGTRLVDGYYGDSYGSASGFLPHQLSVES